MDPPQGRAARLLAYETPLELFARPHLVPGPGEVAVDVRACGVCGSDLFLVKGGFDSTLPIVPGHEAAGVVAAVGEGADHRLLGRPVALYYIDHCGECRWCRAARPNLCLNLRRMGVDFDGAFADRVVLPARNVLPVDDTLAPAEVAILTDAMATPYHALTRIANVRRGETVVVFGVGGIGSNAVQLAAWMGARVVAVSRSSERLAMAQRLGAEMTIVAGDDVVEHIQEATGPSGPDVILQAAGSALVDEQAVASAGVACRVVLIGASAGLFRARAVELIWKEATIAGSRGYTPEDITAVIQLRKNSEISTEHLLQHQRPLDEVNAALADLAGGLTLRSVIVFGDGW